MENERLIYKWNDGVKDRYSDPLKVLRQMFAVEGLDLEALLAKMDFGDEAKAMKAMGTLVAAARAGFDLPEFDEETGEGLTDFESLKLFGDFWEWVQKKSINTSLTQTFTASTEPPQD